MKLIKNLNFWQFLASLLIAFVVYDYGKKTTTMTAISELRDKSDLRWQEITLLPKSYDALNFSQRDLVASYINEYEHFCTLYNKGIISSGLVEITRKDTILYVQDNYGPFISDWRIKNTAPEAWKQLELCAKSMRD